MRCTTSERCACTRLCLSSRSVPRAVASSPQSSSTCTSISVSFGGSRSCSSSVLHVSVRACVCERVLKASAAGHSRNQAGLSSKDTHLCQVQPNCAHVLGCQLGVLLEECHLRATQQALDMLWQHATSVPTQCLQLLQPCLAGRSSTKSAWYSRVVCMCVRVFAHWYARRQRLLRWALSCSTIICTASSVSATSSPLALRVVRVGAEVGACQPQNASHTAAAAAAASSLWWVAKYLRASWSSALKSLISFCTLRTNSSCSAPQKRGKRQSAKRQRCKRISLEGQMCGVCHWGGVHKGCCTL